MGSPASSRLLSLESQFAGALAKLDRFGVSAAMIRDCLHSFPNCELLVGRAPSLSDFRKPALALSPHGIGHTVRVMFWVSFLARIQGLDERTVLLALSAAYLHDLARIDEAPGFQHGEAAAGSGKTQALLSDLDLTAEDIEWIIQVIRQHCVEDDDLDDPLDTVSQLLRNADALDRGRFGEPGEPEGCDVDRLGLPLFQTRPGLAHALARIAFQVAAFTQYENWSGNTYVRLIARIEGSLRSCVQSNVISGDVLTAARAILD